MVVVSPDPRLHVIAPPRAGQIDRCSACAPDACASFILAMRAVVSVGSSSLYWMLFLRFRSSRAPARASFLNAFRFGRIFQIFFIARPSSAALSNALRIGSSNGRVYSDRLPSSTFSPSTFTNQRNTAL